MNIQDLVDHRVHHVDPRFGNGLIIGIKPTQDDWIVNVQFDNGKNTSFMFKQSFVEKKFFNFLDPEYQNEVNGFIHDLSCSQCGKYCPNPRIVDDNRFCEDCYYDYIQEIRREESRRAEIEFNKRMEYYQRSWTILKPHALYKYIPTSYYFEANEEDVVISRRILDYKNGVSYAFNFFTNELQNALLRIAEEADYEAFSLVAVPTSTAEDRPIIADSIAHIIENIQGGRLSKKAFHDCSDVLTRVQTIPKSHLCPPELRPDEYNHYMTIECRETELQQNCLFILMDDIITRGAHMRACRKVMMDAGVPEANFYYLAIGYTSSPGYEDRCEYV